MCTFKQENGYTKHMAVHASNMMSGRMQADHGCGTGDRYHIFSDVDALYPGRRRHSGVDPTGDMKKTGRLFRPATMSAGDTAELPADAAGLSAAAAGRYGGLFSPPAPGADSTSYGKFGHRHKSAAGGGSLVDALNDASSPGSCGNRSDCGDGVASSPLAVTGGAGALMSGVGGGGASLFTGSFGYDVDDVGIYRRSMSARPGIDDGASFRPHVSYPFAQSYLNHAPHHQTDPSSFVLRQTSDHQSSLLPHQQQQHPHQNSSIFYGQSSALADTDGATSGGRETSPVDGRTRRYFSPAASYFGATPAPGSVMSATYGGTDSTATRYDGALGSLNSYLQRGGAFTAPGMASALHHLARSLPVFR